MKIIENNATKYVHINDIDIGQCFKHHDNLYMRLDRAYNDTVLDFDNAAWAVNLEATVLMQFDIDHEVERVDAEVVIK